MKTRDNGLRQALNGGQPAIEVFGPAEKIKKSLSRPDEMQKLEDLLQSKTRDRSLVPVLVTRLIDAAPAVDQPLLESLFLGLSGRYSTKASLNGVHAQHGLSQEVIDRHAERLDEPLGERIQWIVKRHYSLRSAGKLLWTFLAGLEEEPRLVAQVVIANSRVCPYHPLPTPRRYPIGDFQRRQRDLLAYVWAVVRHFGPDTIGLSRHLNGGILADKRLAGEDRALLLAAAFEFHNSFCHPPFRDGGLTLDHFTRVEAAFEPLPL